MDKERSGMMMEAFILVDTRRIARLKGNSISYNEITLIHSSMSSMIKWVMI